MTDLNACRHPRNEVINPAAPGRIFPISTVQARSEKSAIHSQLLLQVIRNSKKGRDISRFMALTGDNFATESGTFLLCMGLFCDFFGGPLNRCKQSVQKS
jgi:hypothetical protein